MSFRNSICIIMALAATSTSALVAQGAKVLILTTSVDKFTNADRKTGVWLEEFAVPYSILTNAGIQVSIVSPKGGAVPIDPASMPRTDAQKTAWASGIAALHNSITLTADVKASDYDAIFVPGGHGPLFDLATNTEAARLVSDFARAGKVVASVCHGPAGLVGATLADGSPFVKGKRLTSFSDSEEGKGSSLVPFSVQQRLSELGAIYSKGPDGKPYTVVDGNLITGQNPASSQKVAELLLVALKK
jgi:putative intracellular protease/amidase